MTERNDATQDWMGVRKNGAPIQISHAKLMEWAYDHGQQFNVGWSNAVTLPDGARLVRGNYVDEARKAGWADLADKLEAFLGADGERKEPSDG